MIVINTRVLKARMTGVQRYTSEILKRLPEGEVRCVTSPPSTRKFQDIFWEQFLLPFSVGRSDVLWSPGNTGPISVRNQVLTIHDIATIDFPDDFSLFYKKYYSYVFKFVIPRVESIITVSEYTRQRVIEKYSMSPHRIHSIPLGVDHNRFKPQDEHTITEVRTRLGLPVRYVLYLGTLSVRKNIRKVLSAWALIQRELPEDVHLVVSGEAGASHVFEGGDALPNSPRTIFTGRVREDDLAAILGGAEVFVFPSFYEGFGLPVLEAMACGTPCVVSDRTSLPEVVGDAALKVDPDSVEEIAGAMDTLIRDRKSSSEMTSKGFARAAMFTWDATARKTWEVISNSRISRSLPRLKESDNVGSRVRLTTPPATT